MVLKNGSAKGQRLWFWIAVILFLGHSLFLYRANYYQIADDAYISFRYARNFAHGNGLVYNPGEKVEGYTNFLWNVLLSPFIAFGAEAKTTAIVWGLIFGLATLHLVYRTARLLGTGRYSVFLPLACLLLAADGSFAFWAIGGLETQLFGFLTALSVYFYLKDFIWISPGPAEGLSPGRRRKAMRFGATLALATMARPEGLLIGAIFLAHQLFIYFHYQLKQLEIRRGWASEILVPSGKPDALTAKGQDDFPGGVSADPPSASRTELLLSAGVFGLIYLPYFIWRYQYYGYFFPNPFYAKVGVGWFQWVRGARYLYDFAWARGWLLVAVLPWLIMVWPRRSKPEPFWRPRRRSHWLLALISLTYTLYILYVGGDWPGAFRFFVPVLPFFYLLVQETVERLWRPNPWLNSAAISILLVITLAASSLYGEYRRFVLPYRYLRLERLALGQWFKANVSPGTLIACQTGGVIPYYAELPTIDLFGLTDVHIAHMKSPFMGRGRAGHEKWDLAYILQRRPEYIIFQGPKSYDLEPLYQPFTGVPEQIRFYHSIYQAVH